MLFSRPGAASACLRAALLFVVMTVAAPAFSFADDNRPARNFNASAPAALLAMNGQSAEDDLFENPGLRGGGKKKALFTILFNADTAGELHPCPT